MLEGYRASLLAGVTLVALSLFAEPASAQSDAEGGVAIGVRDPAEANQLMLRFYLSGIRRSFTDQTMFGELGSRVGASRLAAGVEATRTGPLRGQIAGLQAAIASGRLPAPAVAALTRQIEGLQAQLAAVPRYESDADKFIGSVSGTYYLGDVAGQPVWFFGNYRGAPTWERERAIRFEPVDHRLQAGLYYAPSENLLLGLSAVYQPQDSDLIALQGKNTFDAFGFRGDLGYILGQNLAFTASIDYARITGKNRVVQPSATGPVGVTAPLRQDRFFYTAKLLGRFTANDWEALPSNVELQPFAAVYNLTSLFEATTNSLGQRVRTSFSTGREDLLLGQVGNRFVARLDAEGRVEASTEIGYERELRNNVDLNLKGGDNLVLGAGLAYSFGLRQRVGFDYRRRVALSSDRNSNEGVAYVIWDF